MPETSLLASALLQKNNLILNINCNHITHTHTFYLINNLFLIYIFIFLKHEVFFLTQHVRSVNIENIVDLLSLHPESIILHHSTIHVFFSKSIFTSLFSCLPVIYTDIFSLNTNSGFWCKCINDILVITMRTKLIFFLVISIFHGFKLQTHFITGKKKSLRHVFTESLFTFLAGKHHFIRLS